MKTTLNIHDTLLYQAKAFAVEQRTTLTRLIEEGLRLRLMPMPALLDVSRQSIELKLPVLPSKGGKGLHPNINPLSNKNLYDAADDFRRA